ncbi:GntR family transcriptional regulator [Streptomyces sp. H27-C3]|uniref:GntR family transcriptional regulator n=1 Tax=Streptomyces sp. H27-C3 TaxID=3046305 RepID=UPI0024BA480A|nr:GntR family transcriptional regulator [Streptomyces sp. H27-C3]MDJ0465986.1 GntR family transcriptional regulator [Streptomyces sp. H27-C3]
MSNSRRARWESVYDDLRRKIDEGSLGPGDQLPGEFALAEEHGVSRSTIRTAVTRLVQDGLVTEGRGRLGRTVRRTESLKWELSKFERGERGDDPARGVDAWGLGVEEQGRTPGETIKVSIEPAPSYVAERLELPVHELVVRRHRIRTIDDVPFQLSTSWFPEDIARGTPLMEERTVTMNGGILAASGFPQRRLRDEITVRMPLPDESRELKLPVATPVAQHTRIGYGDDRPVRCMVSIAPGDRHVLIYEMEA